MLNIEKLITLKNKLIQRLELAKKQCVESQIVHSLAKQAAEYEGEIAQNLIDSGKADAAIVNLLSQASCLIDANSIEDCIVVYKRALGLCNSEPLRNWIVEEIKNIQPKYQL